VLLLEHPTATVNRQDVSALARRIRSVADRRGTAVLVLTADLVFADSLGGRTVTLDAATGKLIDRRGNGWFGRWLG